TKKYLNIGDIVLDYGCATGAMAFEIADNVKKIHGIAISQKMIGAAKFDESYKKENFDVILAFNILHFSEDTPKVMQRIHELLKPGGLFISATPCQGETNSFLGILLFLVTKMGIIPPMRFYKISELEDFVTGENFHIVETECLNPTEYFMVAKKK
ncbi:MAG: class I SAM-dependent methyltransferase, partial [Methanoregulaceae archaeon]